jgi:hypothetical protein
MLRDEVASDSGDRRLEILVRDRDTNTGNAVSVEKMTSTDAASVCLGQGAAIVLPARRRTAPGRGP